MKLLSDHHHHRRHHTFSSESSDKPVGDEEILPVRDAFVDAFGVYEVETTGLRFFVHHLLGERSQELRDESLKPIIIPR